MSVEIHRVNIGSCENVASLYYGYAPIGGIPLSPLRATLPEVVALLDEQDIHMNRDEFLTRQQGADAIATTELTAETIQLLQYALQTLEVGHDISSEQKRLLFDANRFFDEVLHEGECTYDELNDTKLVEAEGLAAQAMAYTTSEPPFELYNWIEGVVLFRVFADEALRQLYPDIQITEPATSSAAERRIAAAYFRLKADLATGALYAAGVEGDDLAMQVAEAVQHIVVGTKH